MSHLITPSLIGAISWVNNCPYSWREKATLDLRSQLVRDYSEPMGPALKLGLQFEESVYTYAAMEESKGSDHFKWFINECKGGQFQRKTKQFITIDDQEYCLYGKIDAWWPNIIKDIKTTSNYHGEKSYLASFQHKMYCYNEKISHFRYIVGEFDADQNLIDHHAIDYTVQDPITLQDEIVQAVKEAIAYLKGRTNLWTLYTTKFSAY